MAPATDFRLPNDDVNDNFCFQTRKPGLPSILNIRNASRTAQANLRSKAKDAPAKMWILRGDDGSLLRRPIKNQEIIGLPVGRLCPYGRQAKEIVVDGRQRCGIRTKRRAISLSSSFTI